MRPSELWAAYEEAFAAGDRERIRSFFADDMVAVDHRPLGFGEIRGGDAFFTYAVTFLDLSPGATPHLRELLGETERTIAAVIEVRGGTDDAPVGLDYILVNEIRDGRALRVWFFPPEARQEALRTLAAL